MYNEIIHKICIYMFPVQKIQTLFLQNILYIWVENIKKNKHTAFYSWSLFLPSMEFAPNSTLKSSSDLKLAWELYILSEPWVCQRIYQCHWYWFAAPSETKWRQYCSFLEIWGVTSLLMAISTLSSCTPEPQISPLLLVAVVVRWLSG